MLVGPRLGLVELPEATQSLSMLQGQLVQLLISGVLVAAVEQAAPLTMEQAAAEAAQAAQVSQA